MIPSWKSSTGIFKKYDEMVLTSTPISQEVLGQDGFIGNGSVNESKVVPTVINSTTEIQNVPTATIVPTMTPTMTPTPTVIVPNTRHSYSAVGRYSWYWPPLGGVNCDEGDCDHVANGFSYSDYIDVGCACPANVPMGSNIYIVELGRSYLCVDRGGAIVVDDTGRYWIDVLADHGDLAYGSEIHLEITYPY